MAWPDSGYHVDQTENDFFSCILFSFLFFFSLFFYPDAVDFAVSGNHEATMKKNQSHREDMLKRIFACTTRERRKRKDKKQKANKQQEKKNDHSNAHQLLVLLDLR